MRREKSIFECINIIKGVWQMRKVVQLSFASVVLLVNSAAEATVYDITGVLNGVDGGFGFSGFHYAGDGGSGVNGDGNPMTGSALAGIPTATGFLGSYDDVSGAFTATLGSDFAPIPTFTLSGNMLFDGAGFLAPASTLDITFHTIAGDFTTGMDFAAGQVCCSGANPPNSFDGSLLSLWGANSTVDLTSIAVVMNYFPEYVYTDPLLGMDLRLELTAVPVPAAVWLFGSGLIGLVGFAARRKT
jgi:hypothetical protein